MIWEKKTPSFFVFKNKKKSVWADFIRFSIFLTSTLFNIIRNNARILTKHSDLALPNKNANKTLKQNKRKHV